MWVIGVPITIPISKNKSFSLNLNQYRNAHHQTLNKAKVNFKELVTPWLDNLPRMEKVNLTYTLFVGTRQLVDVANVCSIVDKFFSDTLVSAGVIEDDNYQFIPSSLSRFGGFEKGLARVEITIEPIGSTWPRPENS